MHLEAGGVLQEVLLGILDHLADFHFTLVPAKGLPSSHHLCSHLVDSNLNVGKLLDILLLFVAHRRLVLKPDALSGARPPDTIFVESQFTLIDQFFAGLSCAHEVF